MLCSEASVVNTGDGKVTAATLYCKRWTCQTCAPKRQKGLKALARAGEPTLFLTLTSRLSDDSDPDESARALVRAWQLIVKRAKRKFQIKRLPFITIIERTKKGMPHLHILLRLKWLPQKWISEQMDDITGAPIVYIEQIQNSAKIAAYVSKYIAKEPHQFAGCKRYWRSQDWVVDVEKWLEWKKKTGVAWSIRYRSIIQVERELLEQGWAIEWHRHDYFVAEMGFQ